MIILKKLKSAFLLCVICSVPFLGHAQDTGVLVLAHGGSPEWNELVIKAAEPLKKEHKVEVAFGMANYVSMFHAVEALEKKGVDRIAVVQLFISSYSPIIEQNKYLLGERDSLPERPMPLMMHVAEYKQMMGIEKKEASHSEHSDSQSEHASHSSKSSHSSHASAMSHHQMYMPENLQPVPVKAEVIITPALDDHPVVAQILNARIQELSSNPTKETVILVAHGPNHEDDNRKWVDTMESLSKKIQSAQAEQGNSYKQIFSLTVRDDAPEPIFNQAKENLRSIVRQADMFGDVIVVPLYLSSGGREQAVAERLKGLDYKWNGKTLLPDALITDFMIQSVEKAFAE